MNSPGYYTVYPPFVQTLFALIASVTGTVMGFAVGLGALIALADYYIFRFLISWSTRLKLSAKLVILFSFHPLVLIEGVGNLHFEIIMLALMLYGVDLIRRSKGQSTILLILSGTVMALSVLTKLHSLIIIPFVLLCLGSQARLKTLIGFIITMVLGCLPLVIGMENLPFMSSLDLYYRSFEFNASIYFLVRWVGQMVSGYNQIALLGPALAVMAGVLILFLLKHFSDSVRSTESDDIKLIRALSYGGLALCSYFFLATTVHPWYLILPLGVLILRKERWVIAWGVLAFLSYARYVSVEETSFYYLAISVEYLAVAATIFYMLWTKVKRV